MTSEIIQILEKLRNKSARHIKTYYSDEYSLLSDYFLLHYKTDRISNFYSILENQISPHLCNHCGLNYTRLNTQFCSTSCANQNPEKMEKTRKNNLQKYGVENISQIEHVRESKRIHKADKVYVSKEIRVANIKKAFLQKYGVEHPMKTESVKNKMKTTNLERYGVECTLKSNSVRDKIKTTNLEKYGYENPMSSSIIQEKARAAYNSRSLEDVIETREKTVKTNMHKYGGISPLSNPEIKQKVKLTNLERYGCENPSSSEIVKRKIQNNNLEKYGVLHASQIHLKDFYENIEDVIETYNSNKSVYETAKKYGVDHNVIVRILLNRNIEIPKEETRSSHEAELLRYIRSFGIECIPSAKILKDENKRNPFEVDIYIPSKKLAIELNGLYWHSDKIVKRDYHLEKLKLCEKYSVQLLQFWEHETYFKMDIVKSMVLSKLGIYARKFYARNCKIREISVSEYRIFCEINHIQGYAAAKIKIGLFYNDELVSIMSFSKSRFDKTDRYEMVRYCSKLNTIVIGGASKLFKFFNSDKNIVTFSDKRYSNGSLYNTLGFDFSHDSKPGFFYAKGLKTESRISNQKHKLKDKLKIYDSELSEIENMKLNGYNILYDCGQSVWIFDTRKK